MNTKTSYTPGPWGLETVATSCGSCHKIGPFPPDRMGRETHACVYADGIRIGIDESTPRAKELGANARLIAAAPELAEALLAYLEADNTMIDAWTAKARAALAKAGVLEPDSRDPDIRQGRYAQYDNITGKRL